MAGQSTTQGLGIGTLAYVPGPGEHTHAVALNGYFTVNVTVIRCVTPPPLNVAVRL